MEMVPLRTDICSGSSFGGVDGLTVEAPQKIGEDVGLVLLIQELEPTFLIHLDPPGTEHLSHVRLGPIAL